MTDPATTIRRLHEEHCPRGARCPHGVEDYGTALGNADPFNCPMYAAIEAGYRDAVGDAVAVTHDVRDRMRPAHTDIQRGAIFGVGHALDAIKALAPKGPPE